MNRKIMILLIICFFVGTYLIPCISGNINYHKNVNNENIIDCLPLSVFDHIDQYQENFHSDGGPSIINDLDSSHYQSISQEFIPTLSYLTRIELVITNCNRYPQDGPLIVSITKELDEDALTSIVIPSSEIPNWQLTWYNIDLSDIRLTPGETYHILVEAGEKGSYCSGQYQDNPYPAGDCWMCNIYNGYFYWGNSEKWDIAFRTYGFNSSENQPPGKPFINGPKTGKSDSVYSCSFISIDPEGDDIFYEIDWGDGNVGPWSGPIESNEKISITHKYLDKGEFNIMARAKDIYGNIGEWGTLTVSIPKSKAINTALFLQKLIERFPFMVKIINQIT